MSKQLVVVNGKLVKSNAAPEKMVDVTVHNAGTVNEFKHRTKLNSDNTPMRVRRSGRTQFWKTRPNEFKIPVKYGLYESGYITHENAAEWYISAK